MSISCQYIHDAGKTAAPHNEVMRQYVLWRNRHIRKIN